ATEAAWRILGFHVLKKDPACTELPIHLPDSTHYHQYHRKSGESSTLSLLHQYFYCPLDGQQTLCFSHLTFADYFCTFHLEKFKLNNVVKPGYYFEQTNHQGSPPKMVILQFSLHVTRIVSIPPSKGELFYLRSLLIHWP
ncbi:hypothetical protein EV360DRAFT_2448, partial [Lentinula raphanica]